MTIGRECTLSSERLVLAFYGLDLRSRVSEPLYQTVLTWFLELGFPPDQLGVTREGQKSGKLGDFKRTHANLQKKGFDDVVFLEVNVGLPNASIPSSQFFASAVFSIAQNDSYCIVAVPVESVPMSAWHPLVNKLVEISEPCYGIGYRRCLEEGPILYALGLNYNAWRPGMSEEERDVLTNISRWCNIGMGREVYRDGLIRDVYPWNFLTQPQLNRPVGKTTLEKWIQQDAACGQLSPMPKGVVMWEVEDSRIPVIRSALLEADVVFDWRKFIKSNPRVK
jgi:hypothetical protein